jgi:2-phospho-L-lactate transferase/gluconeogenesis factor (CofD/UPF0052 family)
MLNKLTAVSEGTKNYFNKYNPYIVVFRGGSGARSLSEAIYPVTHHVCYILPVTDNGGSTRPILDILGGPAIGDIRNALTELLKWRNHDNQEKMAIAELFNYRLGKDDDETLKNFLHSKNMLEQQVAEITSKIRSGNDNQVRSFNEYNHFLNGDHPLLNDFTSDRRGLLLREFREVYNALVGKNFDFVGASLGNLFLSGVRLGTGSLSSAILHFREMANIKEEVLPIIDSNKQISIAAELGNGSVIYGQKDISYSSSEFEHKNIINKDNNEKLFSPIVNIFNIDNENHLCHPYINTAVSAAIKKADLIVYAYGSFWTSLMPSLIVEGIAKSLSASKAPKLFLANGYPDRETYGMTIAEMTEKIKAGLEQSSKINLPINRYITDVGYLNNTSFELGNIDRSLRLNPLSGTLNKKGQLEYTGGSVVELFKNVLEY